jgi:hypothetical protein
MSERLLEAVMFGVGAVKEPPSFPSVEEQEEYWRQKEIESEAVRIYLAKTPDEIQNMIQQCPVDSAPTIRLLNICEKINDVLKTLIREQQP